MILITEFDLIKSATKLDIPFYTHILTTLNKATTILTLKIKHGCDMDRITIQEHLRSPPVRVAQSLVSYVVFCVQLVVCVSFFFGQNVVSLFQLVGLNVPLVSLAPF